MERDEGESSRGGGGRGRGKMERDGGESSRGGGGRGRRKMERDEGESSRAGGGRGDRGSERGGSSGGRFYEGSEGRGRKTGETGKARSNGRGRGRSNGQGKGRVNQDGITEISNKRTGGMRSDIEDKGMSRGDGGKKGEGLDGGPEGIIGGSSVCIRTLVGRLLKGRFDDGGGIKISGDEGVQGRFDEKDRVNVKTSLPSETSTVGQKGEISSAVGQKGEMSSAVGGKGEMSSAAGGKTKTTRYRKLKISKKIVKVRNCSF